METEALVCSSCGAALEFSGKMVCKCEYCGVTNFISSNSAKIANRLNRANKYRQEGKFDEAINIYDEIVDSVAPTVDVLWGKTLCIYGIEYVKDSVSSESKPTLNRIEDEDILDCESYREAIELADDEQKAVLKESAEEISGILDGFRKVVRTEEPYDVFICYKDTDENKEPTIDRERGQELYERLTALGLRVFFSHFTLKEKLSEQFEPYIFAALQSASVMVLLLSKEEYLETRWLKNEWSRFIKLKKKDPQKQFFIACENPENLPKEFRRYEVQKISEIGAMGNIVHSVQKHIERNCPNRLAQKKQSSGNTLDVEKAYRIAAEQNQVKNFAASNDQIDKVIVERPGYAAAYWLRLCNTMRIRVEEVSKCRVDLRNQPDYVNAINCANPTEKKQYEEAAEACLKNIEAYQVFLNKKSDVIEQYEKGVKAKDLKNKLKQKEKESKKGIGKTTIYQAGMSIKFLISGILLFLFYGFLVLFCIKADVISDVDSLFIAANFINPVAFAGLILMSVYLRLYWSALLGVFFFAMDVLNCAIIPMKFDNLIAVKVFAVLSVVIHVIYFVLIISGYVAFLTRPRRAAGAIKEYNNTFIEYANMICADVEKAFDETLKETGIDFYEPSGIHARMNKVEYNQIDGKVREYLSSLCMYDSLLDVFGI